ncbi:Serine/threonine protein kinase [Chondrus crispus]|uniref:Serine/threonine protein kinase n=1 Tax=Chondrus crispus TaxID=2769 RepID=R7QPR2_CHOCR|nr:Serine/threonine protein kinase [Chondrus crispus]CDF40084.1 Serine/threonine protein kinase [Chondrus crispus]|eukprot:XP_005710378.1 Serine/threonine protein kinase [Chondrus crispus]
MSNTGSNDADGKYSHQGCTSGYLRRAKKKGKTLALRRKRWYALDGAIFSKHFYEHINIQGSEIERLGKTYFAIVLKSLADGEAASDFDQNNLILHAKTEEDCTTWVKALKYASVRRIENHYTIGPLIGEGGFAQVRLGKCIHTGEPKAIKTMKKDEAYAKIFGTEVAIIKKVNHPNIVKTYDVFETSMHIHIVMEYLEGGMLYDAIEDGVRFDEEDIAQFMRELIDGILYLHDMGIVHRDLKPENVLCKSRKPPLHVKIADFGLSSLSSVAGHRANQMVMSTVIGTPEFIAPEIARREAYTEKVDIWALGMLCYNVICGALPINENMDILPQLMEGVTLSFPEPEWRMYSELSRSFVRALLCNEPKKRLSPLGCLVHPWLESHKPKESNKVGAHGRVSAALLRQEPSNSFRFSRSGLLSLASRERVRFKYSSDVKRYWKVAYMAVVAVNWFDSFIHPERYKTFASESHAKRTSHTSSREGRESENNGEQSNDFCMPDTDMAMYASDTDDDSAVFSPFLSKSITEEEQSGRLLKVIQSKRKSTGQENKLTEKVSSLRPGHTTAPGRIRSFEGQKKNTMNKFLSAISQGREKRLAPVRKFSKRLGLIGEDKKRRSAALSSKSKADFDMDLKSLNVVSVQDGDIQGLDDFEDSVVSSPSSLFGKRHKSLMRNLKKKVTPSSPTTPSPK